MTSVPDRCRTWRRRSHELLAAKLPWPESQGSLVISRTPVGHSRGEACAPCCNGARVPARMRCRRSITPDATVEPAGTRLPSGRGCVIVARRSPHHQRRAFALERRHLAVTPAFIVRPFADARVAPGPGPRRLGRCPTLPRSVGFVSCGDAVAPLRRGPRRSALGALSCLPVLVL